MQYKKIFLAFLVVGLLFTLSATGITAESYDETRVRYILADMKLGGPVSFYKEYPEDPNSAEAVKRWDDGVSVTNVRQFERKLVEGKGWQIVYEGTETTINGMDVKLTSD